jgi:hypothetical protein
MKHLKDSGVLPKGNQFHLRNVNCTAYQDSRASDFNPRASTCPRMYHRFSIIVSPQTILVPAGYYHLPGI